MQLPIDQETLQKIMKQNQSSSIFQILGEMLYNQRKSLHDIFDEFKTQNNNNQIVLTYFAFENMIQKYVRTICTKKELKVLFDSIPKAFSDYLTFNEFEAAFKISIPQRDVKMSLYPEAKRYAEEKRIILKVLEWQHKRKYTSEDAFERLLRSVQRGQQKSLRRYDF